MRGSRGISCVYKIWFEGSKNFYIGSTKDLLKRFQDHRCTIKKSTHRNMCLINAYKKYGFDNCFVEVLKVCDISELFMYEQYFIDTLKPKYNIAKTAIGGAQSKLTVDDILNIRRIYFTREYQEDIESAASHYGITLKYLQSIAISAKFSYIKNPPELQEIIDSNIGKKVPRKQGVKIKRVYKGYVTRKFNSDEIGMIRWAIRNNKNLSDLSRKLGLKSSVWSVAESLINDVAYKEFTEEVDASHLELLPGKSKKTSIENVKRIKWALKEGIKNKEIAKAIGCSTYIISDIKSSKYFKHITDVIPCPELFDNK